MFNKKVRTQILGGCLEDFKAYLAGTYKGYYITLENQAGRYLIKINATSPDDNGNTSLGSCLSQQARLHKQLVQTQTYDHCAVLTIQGPNLAKNIPPVINEIVDPVISYLVMNGYVSGCEHCGNTQERPDCYEINGGCHYLCRSCTEEIQRSLQEQQQTIVSQKSRLVPGLVGAFLGSLIGCILWVLIYKLGYIAGVAGAVTGICAMKGYEMFGGRLDKKGVIGSVLIMFVTLYFANKLAWSWDAYEALSEYGLSFSETYQQLGDLLTESGHTDYIKELIIGYVLTIACSYRNIANAFKASAGSFSFKKLNK